MTPKTTPARPGDWIEVHSPGGGPVHRGQIVEVLGRPGHEHYRVHWIDDRMSIFFPADGSRILPAHHEELSRP